LGGRAELAGTRRGCRGRRVDGRDRGRRRAEGERPAVRGARHRRCVRESERDRARVPQRPPARVRDHVDRAARGGGRRRRPRQPGPRRPAQALERHSGGRDASEVMGPNLTWYLAVSAFLFAIGALGVMLRRSPLIVLLSIEIMLNGANLALITFSRNHADLDGQIFALAVMAVAASEVVVGLGLIVAVHRRKLELDVDKLSTLRG